MTSAASVTMNTAVPTTAVDTTTLAGSTAANVPDFSLVGMFGAAGLIEQVVIILMLLCSFWCWAIIFEKSLRLKAIKAKTARFESEFWSSEALDTFHERIKKRAPHPVATLFLAAMDEWFRSRAGANTAPSARTSLRERINGIMAVTRNREMERLEDGMGFLASIGSTAPFIGLFGTVFGIIDSFQAIAISKNTSLAVVAPGIAGALFATAMGLLAAIPAVMAYNYFAGELGRLSGRLDDFASEFSALLSRQLEGAA